MKKEIKEAIEEYQCIGCVSGGDINCGKFKQIDSEDHGCQTHYAGTIVGGVGKVLLGMPRGFNRVGHQKELRPALHKNSNLHKNKMNCTKNTEVSTILFATHHISKIWNQVLFNCCDWIRIRIFRKALPEGGNWGGAYL